MQILQLSALKHPISSGFDVSSSQALIRADYKAREAKGQYCIIQNGGATIHTGCQFVTYSGMLV